jgi:hypothetical protein
MTLEATADLAKLLGLLLLALMAAVFLVLSLCLLGHCWRLWRGVPIRPRRRSRAWRGDERGFGCEAEGKR